MAEKLYIIIPAYNEETNIEVVVREWASVVAACGEGSRLVVVDDGSKDSTYRKLLDIRSEVPQLLPLHKANSGHGATLLFGYRYALQDGADFIFQTDSDGQTLASEFQRFWDDRHDFDAIIGYRNHRQDGLSRVLVTKVLKLVIRMVFKERIVDANTPFRLMNRGVLERHIGKIPEGFNLSNVMLSVLFHRFGEKVEYLPITFRPRQGGKNSINLRKIIRIGKQAVIDFRKINASLADGVGSGRK